MIVPHQRELRSLETCFVSVSLRLASSLSPRLSQNFFELSAQFFWFIGHLNQPTSFNNWAFQKFMYIIDIILLHFLIIFTNLQFIVKLTRYQSFLFVLLKSIFFFLLICIKTLNPLITKIINYMSVKKLQNLLSLKNNEYYRTWSDNYVSSLRSNV